MRNSRFATISRFFRSLSSAAVLAAFSSTLCAQSWEVPSGLPTGVGAARMLTTSTGDVYYSALTSAFSFETFTTNYSTGIYKSSDGGLTFAASATGLGSPGLGEINVFEEVGGELWFGGKAGFNHSSDWFFRSTDGGTTWTSTGTGQDVRPIEFAADAGAFYAYTSLDRVWKSLDSGVTWTDFTYGRANFPRYQTINGRRYYLESVALKVSDDGGITRTLATATTGVPGGVLEFGGSIYCFSKFKPYYRSADNGATWETIANIPGYPNLRIVRMFTVGGRLFATTSNEFSGGVNPLLFTDDGDHWAELKLPGQPTAIPSSGLSGSRLVALNGTALLSRELGPLTGPPAILMAPQSSEAPIGAPFTISVYATGATPATYQWYQGASGDISQPVAGGTFAALTIPTITSSGDYWVRVTNPAGSVDSPTASLNAVEVWTDQGPAVVTGLGRFYGPLTTPGGLRVIETYSGKVYLSTDGGTTWDGGTPGPLGVNPNLFGNLNPLVYSDGAYFTARSGGPSDSEANLATSTDFVNWTELADFSFWSNPSQIIKNGTDVYISDNGAGFARSTDGGATFALSNSGIPSGPTIYLTDMVRTNTGVLIASRSAQTAHTVVTSSDNGLTWTTRPFKSGTYVLASDLFHAGGITYATAANNERGLWKSTDDGVTWTKIALAGQALESVTVTDGKIVVSSTGTKPSIWISEDAGATFSLLTNTGLDGVDPGKLYGHENFVFLQDNLRLKLLRLRIGTPTGEPVAIVTEPQDATASATTGATLTVEVTGTGPFTYQWFRGLGGSGTPVGTNSPSYTTDPAVDGDASYYVEISNGFGPPTRSRDVLVSYLFGPRITFDFRDKAYFVGTTPTFGPSFFPTTPEDTDYQWYRGESGDTTTPIAGGTAARIGPPLVTDGDRVWLRAMANGVTVDSSAGTISAVAWTAGNLDLISRDPGGQTWNYGLPPNLSEDGRFAYIGALIRLPYSAPEYFDPAVGRGDDISNTGRFVLTHVNDVYDRASDTLTSGVPGSFQIGRSGRYLLVNASENDQIPPGTDGDSEIFIYDRVNATYRGISRPRAGASPSDNDTQVVVEMDANEENVFFSNFGGGTLIPDETATMYIYDIASDSLSVPPPLQGKGGWATFLDASSNGRFLLFSWNAQIENFRASEPRDDGDVRAFLYLYDRDLDVVSHIETPIRSTVSDITVSNDGNIISCRQLFGINNTALWVTARTPGTDVWASKRLLDIPEVSDYAGHITMSDDGHTFLFTTLRWDQLTPGYLSVSGTPTNESNVMAITGFSVGTSAPAPTFADYAATAFAAYPPELRDSTADADANGISNWFEFLSGRAPGGPSRALIDVGNRDGVATISFRQRIGAPAVFTPEFSADLGASGPWIDISDRELDRVEIEPGVWEITVRSPPGAPTDAQFFRLKAPMQ